MSVHPSACPLDCPDHCSLDVTVEAGRVVRVEPRDANPLTDGFICGKVRRIERHLYGADRLLSPGIRTGPRGSGQFRDVSWDEALDLIAKRFLAIRESRGAEAILPYYYGGSNGALTQDASDARFFRRLGASRITRTLCAAATGRAAMGLYGKMPGVAYPDYPKAKLIVVWGQNPSASSIHLVPILKRAMDGGSRLVVIDPRKTPLAKQAHVHLAVRPGADLPLALAVMRHLFTTGRADRDFLAAHTTGADELERRAAAWTFEKAAAVTGISAGDIEAFAESYATTRPAVIRCGWGLERNRNGGSAVAAVLALPAVAGHFKVHGGGYTMSNGAAWKLGAAVTDAESPGRLLNMNDLGQILLDDGPGRVDALFVYNANPLMTVPDQNRVREGLAREDLFTVVFDSMRTDTALWADVVLPATTFLEHTELSRGYGAYSLQVGTPVVAPAGESRPNYEVFGELTRRCGLSRPGDDDTAEGLVAAILAGTQEAPAGLATALAQKDAPPPHFGRTPVQFVDVFPLTPDRKAHLCPADLDAEAPGGLYHWQEEPAEGRRYPLALISPALVTTISSTFAQLLPGPVPLDMHPDDAAARGLKAGDTIRVFNDLGEVVTTLRMTTDLRPGVVLLPKGLWARHTLNGATATALAPAQARTDLGQGACFNDARVEVEKAAG
jgi:anaerobic selenocysteine-containing dehydrogenase